MSGRLWDNYRPTITKQYSCTTDRVDTLGKIRAVLKEKEGMFSDFSGKGSVHFSYMDRECRLETAMESIANLVQEHYNEDLSE